MNAMKAIFDSVMVFQLEKTVTIKVWQVGVVFRFCQLAVLTYVIVMLVVDATWAYSEQPAGTVNAWTESGGYYGLAGLSSFSSLAYCADPAAYSFVYSADYNYSNPTCVKMHPWEISVKGNPVHVTTAVLETRETAWPCTSATSDATAAAVCSARSGTVMIEDGTQCVCTSSRTLYPVGVEKMILAFEHQVEADLEETRFSNVEGSSSTPAGEDGAITTTIESYDASTHAVFAPGETIKLSVEQWLAAAGVSDINAPNTDIGSVDLADGVSKPRFRTCGLRVDIQIDFTNKDGETNEPLYDSKRIHATVTTSAATELWAGNGAKTVYEVYPSGAHGAMTYDKVFVYRQGVAFHFRTSGLFYKFDAQYVVLVLVSALVLLALAKLVATQVAMYMMPGISTMIQHRTREVFDVNARLAEIGMKAALASLQFRGLDVNGNGVLQVDDLVATYATMHGVTAEEAIAVAKLVFAAADDETDALGRPKQLKKKKQKQKETPMPAVQVVTADQETPAVSGVAVAPQLASGVDFSEFLMAREGGQMISFRKYLDLVTKA